MNERPQRDRVDREPHEHPTREPSPHPTTHPMRLARSERPGGATQRRSIALASEATDRAVRAMKEPRR